MDQANKDLGADYVKFVNWDGAFEGHRFCEGSNVEPIDREDTWYFLQWWKDADMIVNGTRIHHCTNLEALALEYHADDFQGAHLQMGTLHKPSKTHKRISRRTLTILFKLSRTSRCQTQAAALMIRAPATVKIPGVSAAV